MRYRLSFLIHALWLVSLFSLYATGVSEQGTPIFEKDYDLGITAIPVEMGGIYQKAFDRYSQVTTPSGGSIRIVAQNRLTNEQIFRARSILEHYLSDKDGVLFGGVKGDIADKMAENGAVLTLLNYRDDGSNKTMAAGQALYEEELPVEGDSWYCDNMYEEHRDAAFEEILHLVHDYGIGVDGPRGQHGASPEFQKKIRAAQEAGMDSIWGVGEVHSDWLKELERENSLSQEYLAAVIDSWYGLWGAWNDPSEPLSLERGMWGCYLPKTRDEVRSEDPAGAALGEEYFCDWLCYNARIDSRFEGLFCQCFDEEIPYTHKSRYLKNVTLTGKGDTGVRVNSYDNRIIGNEGLNRVYFTGRAAEYLVELSKEGFIVKDLVRDRDGMNTLISIEEFVFSDRIVKL